MLIGKGSVHFFLFGPNPYFLRNLIMPKKESEKEPEKEETAEDYQQRRVKEREKAARADS